MELSKSYRVPWKEWAEWTYKDPSQTSDNGAAAEPDRAAAKPSQDSDNGAAALNGGNSKASKRKNKRSKRTYKQKNKKNKKSKRYHK